MSTSFRTETNGLSGAITFANIDNIKLVNTGPELLGVPKAPTATAGTNTTQVATTAFVTAAITAGTSILPSNATPAVPTVTGTPGASTTYSRGDHAHPSMLSNSTPAAGSSSGSAGSSTSVSRADHSHPAGAQLLSPNGYITLPGGVIIQWGTNIFTPGGSNVTFQIPLTVGCWSIALGMNDASNPPTSSVSFSAQTLSGFKGHCSNTFNVSWIAIGK